MRRCEPFNDFSRTLGTLGGGGGGFFGGGGGGRLLDNRSDGSRLFDDRGGGGRLLDVVDSAVVDSVTARDFFDGGEVAVVSLSVSIDDMH